jgi:transketolase
LFLIVGDLGYSVVEPFRSEFPDRFLNAGVAEQNMTGMAAGLASEGYRVFTYSIANFPTLRCLEQIRNDICYHRLPVTVVSVGAGVAYGNLGYSHHAVQDIGIMSSLPELTVLSPADPGEAQACVSWLCQHPRPSYLRIGKAGEPKIHTIPWQACKPIRVSGDSSARLAIVCTGSILSLALDAAAQLCVSGMNVAVYSFSWLHPLQAQDLDELAKHEKILSVEEHIPDLGLGALVRARLNAPSQIKSIGLHPPALSDVGSQSFLRERSGLTVDGIIRTSRDLYWA